ncbi:MAG: hypothetical protein KME20_14435 [Kaiparowitsia implicata GSE-PSE-MK54-09C]|jgi:hypothetical protein|nr:hypothetical protein [Kaiparowitsia implicata GSE-PSE-MK54-09C]
MNQNQRDLRRAAAQAFMESLDQLETRLAADASAAQASPQSPPPPRPSTRPPQAAPPSIVQELAEAVADIEHLMMPDEAE